jgi:hypothetical protein
MPHHRFADQVDRLVALGYHDLLGSTPDAVREALAPVEAHAPEGEVDLERGRVPSPCPTTPPPRRWQPARAAGVTMMLPVLLRVLGQDDAHLAVRCSGPRHRARPDPRRVRSPVSGRPDLAPVAVHWLHMGATVRA